MLKNWENNGTEEIGLVTPTPGSQMTDAPVVNVTNTVILSLLNESLEGN